MNTSSDITISAGSMIGDSDCLLIMLEEDDVLEQTQSFAALLTSISATVGGSPLTTISIMDVDSECDKIIYYSGLYRWNMATNWQMYLHVVH